MTHDSQTPEHAAADKAFPAAVRAANAREAQQLKILERAIAVRRARIAREHETALRSAWSTYNAVRLADRAAGSKT